MFRYFQPHVRETDDCVKRSLLVVLGADWTYGQVQRELNAYKKVTGAKSFNSGRNPHRYAEEVLQAKKISVAPHTTVEQFCRDHPSGRFILDLPGHWVGVCNGDHYDSWDCGTETVNFAYEITTRPYTPHDLRNQAFRNCCTSEIISATETRIRIYDGNGNFVERRIPTELTAGYVRCLQDNHYGYVDLSK